MRRNRTSADLDIVLGAVRSFEWFWASNNEMPGLDAFEALSSKDQAMVIATFEHWGELNLGKHVSETRISEEHVEPKILAAKAGKHRFTMFHAGENHWIVCRYYQKRKQKLDRNGKITIKLTIEDRKDYLGRVNAEEYYERR